MARVALCQDVMVEFMGYMYISSVLKQAGHTVEVFIDRGMDEAGFVREVAEFRPDIVGFSVLTPSLGWSLRVGHQIKEVTRAVTVYGNVHVILCPEVIEDPAVDIVCIGEGEYPMQELASCIDQGSDYSRIASFWVKTPNGVVKNALSKKLTDLESLPFHDRDIYDKYSFFRHSTYMRISNGRGCPFHCTFCSNAALKAHFGGPQYVRKKSPQRAIEELEYHIGRRKNVKYLVFIDEVFWIKNEWLTEFLNLYKARIKLPYTANFRFGPIREEDIILMAEAGMKAVALAVETGNEEQRCVLMEKHVSDEHIFHIAGLLHKHCIEFGSTSFFGIPGDTAEDHVKRLDFYRKVNPTYLFTTFFQPYPKLKLTAHPDVQRQMPKDIEFRSTVHHDMFLDLPDRQRLVNLKKVYFVCIKFPRLSPLLIWMTKYRLLLVFDLIFACHFAYYAFKFEQVSLVQFIEHLKIFALRPLMKKKNKSERKPAC